VGEYGLFDRATFIKHNCLLLRTLTSTHPNSRRSIYQYNLYQILYHSVFSKP
jgi:hypothetical protein